MQSADAACGSGPRRRCAVMTRGATQYLFVVVPRIAPPSSPPAAEAATARAPPPVELEPLMFFDTPPTPSNAVASQPPAPIRTPPPAATAATTTTAPTLARVVDGLAAEAIMPHQCAGDTHTHTRCDDASRPRSHDKADDSQAQRTTMMYSAGDVWAHGSVVIPLQVVSSGELWRASAFAQDEFASLDEVRQTCGPYDAYEEYYALFGALLLDRVYVLVATQVQPVAALPLRGSILRVLETRWVPFDLPDVAPPRMTSADRGNVQEFQRYSYSKGYYYSDDVDLRLPFPFARPSRHTTREEDSDDDDDDDDGSGVTAAAAAAARCADDTAGVSVSRGGARRWAHTRHTTRQDFCYDWSRYIRNSFSRNHRLRQACSVLLRGFAEERVCELRDKERLHLLLLGRQDNRNPGPRYLGRGINADGGVGNEHVYEYVMWREGGGRSAPSTVPYARHTILRGTVPVRWTTQMGVSLAEPAMSFSARKDEVLAGSTCYFVRLFVQLHSLMAYDAQGEASVQPHLRCVNLLRLSAQSGEDVLARHLRDAVRAAEPHVRAAYPAAVLDLVHVDWLSLTRDYGIDVAVASAWETVVHFLLNTHPQGATATSSVADDARTCVPCGTPASPIASASAAMTSTTTATTTTTTTTTAMIDSQSLMTVGVIQSACTVETLLTQSRFVRVNCADSLDRTNLVCFFTCLQVSIAMLHTLCVPFEQLDASKPLPPLDTYADLDSDAPYTAAFAPVSCARQSIPAPFLSSWQDARDVSRLPPCVARQLAELFVANGDCVAMLYTNSAAMHGNLLRDLCGMRRTAHNAVIATQRRYENAFEDRKKLMCIELLLGRNIMTHLSSLSPVYITRPVARSLWASAILVIGIAASTTTQDVRNALLTMWDAKIVPRLRQQQGPALESSALCMTVTLRACSRTAMQEQADASAGSVAYAAGASNAAVNSYNDADRQHGEMAVVELDEVLCQTLDVALLFRREGYVTVHGHNCIVAPYSYPVQETSENDGTVTGAVKNVGTALRQGIKKIVRNLN